MAIPVIAMDGIQRLRREEEFQRNSKVERESVKNSGEGDRGNPARACAHACAREGEREGDRERGREGEGGRKGGREGGREREREGEGEREIILSHNPRSSWMEILLPSC